MSGQLNIGELDLHAYIDGELNAEAARKIEEAASRDVFLAARIADYRADKEALKRVYAPIAERPLPPAWEALIRGKSSPAPSRGPTSSWRMASAIAAAFLIVFASASFFLYHRASAGDVVDAALLVRSDDSEAQKTVTVDNVDQARRYEPALAQIVSANVKVPDLETMGYRVTGLRLYRGAAEILYRNEQGNLFTLYLSRSDGRIRFDQFVEQGLRICVWQDDRISTVMAGMMSAAMMQRLASLTYLGLST